MSNGEHKSVWGVPVPVIVYTLGLGAAAISWAIHVEQILSERKGIITSYEHRLNRVEVELEGARGATQRLQERVDRLDTPLAKLVEQLVGRVQALSERSIQMDGRVQALDSDIKRLESRPR